MTIAINLPDVLEEITAVFARYETALVENQVDVLDALFWHSEAVGLARTLANTVITTYGRDFATAMTEFHREGNPRVGRQSQTWVRFENGDESGSENGWRVVAAHVSLLP